MAKSEQEKNRREGSLGGAAESLVTLSELMLRPADCTPGSLPAKQELTEWQLRPCLHVFSFLFSTILLGRTTRLSRSLLKTENLFRQQLQHKDREIHYGQKGAKVQAANINGGGAWRQPVNRPEDL